MPGIPAPTRPDAEEPHRSGGTHRTMLVGGQVVEDHMDVLVPRAGGHDVPEVQARVPGRVCPAPRPSARSTPRRATACRAACSWTLRRRASPPASPGTYQGVPQPLAVALLPLVSDLLPTLPQDSQSTGTGLDAHCDILAPSLYRFREGRRGRAGVHVDVYGAVPVHQDLDDEGLMVAFKFMPADSLWVHGWALTIDNHPGGRPMEHNRHAARLAGQTKEVVAPRLLPRHEFPANLDSRSICD